MNNPLKNNKYIGLKRCEICLESISEIESMLQSETHIVSGISIEYEGQDGNVDDKYIPFLMMLNDNENKLAALSLLSNLREKVEAKIESLKKESGKL